MKGMGKLADTILQLHINFMHFVQRTHKNYLQTEI
jgi:hypothetical protein